MIKSTILLLLGLLLGLPQVQSQDTEASEARQHVGYLSLGSPALYASLNYELALLERSGFALLPRVGLGFNFFQPSLGQEWNLATGVTGLYGKKRSKLELALGFVHQLTPSYSFEQNRDVLQYKAILYTGVGYRYQPQDQGVLFKILITPTFTINADQWVFFPYAELAVGYVFRRR